MAHASSSSTVSRSAAVQPPPYDNTAVQPQEDVFAAYTTVYDAHSDATQLIVKTMTLLAVHYSPLRRSSNSNSTTAAATLSSLSNVSVQQQQQQQRQKEVEVEELLVRCSDIEARLTSSYPANHHGRHAGRSCSGVRETGTEVHHAVRLLEQCLPAEWQASLAGEKKRKQEGKPPLPSSSSSPRMVYPSAVGPDTLTCPSDVVQLGLLLRRHWMLQRDITLCIPALLETLSAVRGARKGERSQAKQQTMDEVEAPPLSVAVALAVLRLSHMRETLEQTQPPHDDHGVLYSPTEQHLLQSYTYPHIATASTTALTMLPLLLWRSWTYSDEQARAGASPQPQPPLDGKGQEVASLTAEAAAAHGYAAARATTKLVYKWEACIAAYVTAQLSSNNEVWASPLCPLSQDDSSRSIITTTTEADATFLVSVQAELDALRGACNAVQLLWLTVSDALHPASAASPKKTRSQALADVAKRGAKAEKLLRSLLSSTATARLLLPGVLLWMGYLSDQSPGTDIAAATSQRTAYWREAFTLGQQVLGRTHTFVEAVANLLSASPAVSRPPQQQLLVVDSQTCSTTTTAADADAASHRTVTPLIPTQRPPQPPAPSLPPRRIPPPPPTLPLSYSTAPAMVTSATQLPALPLSRTSPLRSATAPSQRLHPSPPPPRVTAATATAVSLPCAPDFTHAFAIAFAAGPTEQRHRPSPPPTLRTMHERGRTHNTENPTTTAAALRSTFPPSRPSLVDTGSDPGVAAAAADDLGGEADGAALQPKPPCKQQPGKSCVSNLAALRNCHRLSSPADAFQLASSVRDAVYEDDLMHKKALARRNGRRKKKGKQSQRDRTASTEALLMSVNAEDSTSTLNDTFSGSHLKHSRRPQRRRRPDRQLLPPLTKVRRVPTEGQANGSNDNHGNAPLNPFDDAPFCPDDQLSSFANDGGEPFWRASVHEGNDSTNNRSTEAAEFATGKELHGSALDNSGAAEAMDNNEEEEEDYDKETLPERNARLQREVRTYFAQLNQRRVHAAAVIQRAWRCSRARGMLHARQQLLYRFVYIIQKAAALAIEGFVLCVWEQRKRRAALATRVQKDVQRSSLERRQLAAAAVLTRAARQWGQRQRDRRRLCEQLNLERDARLRSYAATARVVQRWWREVQQQKAYWRRRNEEVAAEQRRQVEADRLARAATTIQKQVRGVQARSRAAKLKSMRAAEAQAMRLKRDAAVTVLRIVLQEHVHRQARLAREATALQALKEGAGQLIADNWKAAVARRRVDVAVQRAHQLRTSATCIQRAWRRYAAGRQRRYLRQTRRTLQEERLAREFRLSTSVVLVQCAARGALDALLVRSLRARVGRTFMESVVLIQAVCKAGQVRQALGQARLEELARRRSEVAALAQRRLRAVGRVQAMLRSRQSSSLVRQRCQRRLEEKLHVYAAAAREMREDAAATVVQRAVRRHQQRVRAAAAVAEARFALAYLHRKACQVQQAWRAHAARQERRRRAAAVLRGCQQRQEQEEVMELIWHDQKRELDVLYTLEQHYIAEAEHAARIALYRKWLSPSSSKGTKKLTKAAMQNVQRQNSAAEVDRWAALYDD